MENEYMKKKTVKDCFGEVTEVLYGNREEFIAHYKLNKNDIQCDNCFNLIQNKEEIIHVFEGNCWCNSCWSKIVKTYDLYII
jgi:Zn finger protein HypA/HybF involved in hydrogenase expression